MNIQKMFIVSVTLINPYCNKKYADFRRQKEPNQPLKTTAHPPNT